MLQSAPVTIGVANGQYADQALARRDEGVPVADAAARGCAFDLHQARLESHHGPQLDALSHRRHGWQAVDGESGAREVEVRIVAQHQRRGIGHVDDRWTHAGAAQRFDRVMKDAQLRVGDRTLRIAGVGEQRADAFEPDCGCVAHRFDNVGNLRRHHAQSRRPGIDLHVDRKVSAAGRGGGAIEDLDHRRLENERRHVERDNLCGLLGEESGLQIDA